MQTQTSHDKFLKLSFPLLDDVVAPLKALSLFLLGLEASAHTWAGGGGVHFLHPLPSRIPEQLFEPFCYCRGDRV